MNLFDLEVQYQLYLQRVGLADVELMPIQAHETKRAFMGACGQMLDLLTTGIRGTNEDQLYLLLTSMIVQVGDFWSREVVVHEFTESMSVVDIGKQVEPEPVNSYKAKADKWNALAYKIGRCYVDEDGNELPEDEGADLGTIGEIAASAFGYL